MPDPNLPEPQRPAPQLPELQSDFAAALASNLDAAELARIPELDRPLAAKLLERIDSVRLFAHAYSLLGNFTHGTLRPAELLDWAREHGLAGVCIHLLDGEERGLGRMTDAELAGFAAHARRLGLDVHLEISSTEPADVDEVVRIARILGVEHIRVYSRYEGRLSAVLQRVAEDLRYVAELADRHGLQFYFEQHEELKSGEIAAALRELGHPRVHALFDFGNMVNACERPMDALRELAPHIRQVHLKGIHVIAEGSGFGHRGVLQGGPEDDLPGPRMLFELLMLGETEHQLIAFALEQENHYRAPAFRLSDEGPDPFIPYRDMSTTDLPDGLSLAQMLEQEPGWALDQLHHVRSTLRELRELALRRLEAPELAAVGPSNTGATHD